METLIEGGKGGFLRKFSRKDRKWKDKKLLLVEQAAMFYRHVSGTRGAKMTRRAHSKR